MVKKGKNFSGKVTPLFDSMLVQQTKDEAIPDSNPEGSGGNHRGQSSSDRSLSGNEDGLTLQSVYDLRISLCTHVSTQAKEIKALKAQGYKRSMYPNREESIKSSRVNLVDKDPAFDRSCDDEWYMETEDLMMRDDSSVPNEGTDKRNKGTDKQDGGTNNTKVSTDRQGKGTADQNEGKSATQTASATTSTPTPTIFGDDETIAQVLITMSQNKQKEKEKGVEIRNVEDTERPRPTSTRSVLTLKPLPKIDLKDKGKKMIDEEGESDTESDDITEAEKKFKMLAKDERWQTVLEDMGC
ncbi:hypothetical protein Tco_0759311 [Tanacetum coccineum]